MSVEIKLSDLALLDFVFEDQSLTNLSGLDADCDLDLRDQIINFLDRVKVVACETHNVHDALKLSSIFIKWKDVLMRRYSYFYQNSLELGEFDQAKFNEELPESVAAYTESDVVDKIFIGEGGELWGDVLENPVTSKPELIGGDYDISGACNNANSLITAGRLDDALTQLEYLCDQVSIPEHLSKAQLYFYSWALHLKGNVYREKRKYSIAQQKYDKSLHVKKVGRISELLIVPSRINRALAFSYYSPSDAFAEMKAICDEYPMSLKKTGSSSERKFCDHVYADAFRHYGYWCNMIGKSMEGNSYLDKALDMASNNENEFQHLLVLFQKTLTGVRVSSVELLNSYSSLPDHVKSHPLLTSLGSVVVQYRVRHQNRDLYEEIREPIFLDLSRFTDSKKYHLNLSGTENDALCV